MLERTLGSLVSAAAARAPSALALADLDGAEWTWAAFDAETNAIARGLLAAGLERQSVVMAVLPDVPEYVLLHAAAAKAGLIVVPGSWRFKAGELKLIAEDCRPAAVVFAAEAAERVAGAVAGLEAPPLLLEVRGDGAWERLADGQSSAPLQQADGDDIAYVGYTSGTTGRPRGVVLDQATCWRAAHLGASNWNMVPYGTTVLTGSLSFTAVLCSMVWSTIARTAALVLCTPFDVERALWAVERYDGTFMYLPTPAIPAGAAALESAPALDRLVTIATGASTIAPDALGALVEVGGRRVLQAYGLTEASGIPLCVGRRDDWRSSPAGFATAGRVVGPTVFRLNDRAGEAVPHDGDTVGEITISSPTLMRSYWEAPDATAQTLRDGWLHTGDLATIDGDGYVVIRGRSKDTIVSGGINVYPAEIEAVLAASPRISESAVVGGPHPRWGETVVAFVVPAAGEPPGGLADHVRDHCRAQLAHYKTPTRVEVLRELPRNPNGKVLKDTLRRLLDPAAG